MNTQLSPILVTIRDAANLLSVCPRTVQDLIVAKKLKARKVGRRTLLSYRDLVEFSRHDHTTAPEQFWKAELAPRSLSRPSRGWARTTCPFHHGDNPTAFSVNLNTGVFYCHACGAKGDMLSFVMQRDHVDFKAAAVYLGAWDDSALTDDVRCQIAERQQHRKRIDTAAEILAEMEGR
jgi:excisionase family DNA binding protein